MISSVFCSLFRYPIAVQPVHSSSFRTGAKRSARNYDDANQTESQFKRVQPLNERHETEVWIFFTRAFAHRLFFAHGDFVLISEKRFGSTERRYDVFLDIVLNLNTIYRQFYTKKNTLV